MSRPSTLAALLLLCCAIGTTTVVSIDTSIVPELLHHQYRLFAQELGNVPHFGSNLGASLSKLGATLKHFEAKSKFATQSTPADVDCHANLTALAAVLVDPACNATFASLPTITMTPDSNNVPAFCMSTCATRVQVAMTNVEMNCILTNYAAQIMASAPELAFLIQVNLRNLDFVVKGVCAALNGAYCYPNFYTVSLMVANSLKNPSASSIANLPSPIQLDGMCTPCWFKVLSFWAEYANRQQDGKLAFFYSIANAVCMKENGTYCLLETANVANLPTAMPADVPNLKEICRTRCFLRIATLQANSIRLQLANTSISASDALILSVNLTQLEAGKAVYRFVCARNYSDYCFHIYSVLSTNFLSTLTGAIGQKFLSDCGGVIGGGPCAAGCLADIQTFFGVPAGCCLGAAVRFLNNSAVQAQITDPTAQTEYKVLLSCQKAGLDITPCAGPRLNCNIGMNNLKFAFVNNNMGMVTNDITNSLSDVLGSDPAATSVTLSSYTLAYANQTYQGTAVRCSVATDSPQTAFQMKEIIDSSAALAGSIQFPAVSYDTSSSANVYILPAASVDNTTTSSCQGNCDTTIPQQFPYPTNSSSSSSSSTAMSSSSTASNDAPASPLRSSSSLLSILAISVLAFIFA